MKRLIDQNEAVKRCCSIRLADDTRLSTGRWLQIITHSWPKERRDGHVTQPAETRQMHLVFSEHRDVKTPLKDNMNLLVVFRTSGSGALLPLVGKKSITKTNTWKNVVSSAFFHLVSHMNRKV